MKKENTGKENIVKGRERKESERKGEYSKRTVNEGRGDKR